MKHFGIEINNEDYMSIDNYINGILPVVHNYSIKDIKDNYYRNMEYYDNLSQDDFNKELNIFLKKFSGFQEINDLNNYKNQPGWYLMVLDKYKQVYIGMTYDICKRIIQHWKRKYPVENLIDTKLGKDESYIPIDCFRALDTTRIFVFADDNYFTSIAHLIKLDYDNKVSSYKPSHFTFLLEDKETKMIKFFDKKYLCNRSSNGVSTKPYKHSNISNI